MRSSWPLAMRLSLWSCAALLLAAGATVTCIDRAWADTSGAPDVVRYEHGRLTLRTSGTPLSRVLPAISAATGAEIRGVVPTREVTVELDAVPLSEALETVLRDHSFLLRYDPDGALRVIELLGTGPRAVPSASPGSSPAPTSSSTSLADEEAQATILQRPVRVTGALAVALGTETPTAGRLLHAAVREERATARADARTALLAAFAADPEIEAAYLSTLRPVDDGVLARTLRGSAAGEGAEEWMAALVSRAPSPELRAKAAAVLNALHETLR